MTLREKQSRFVKLVGSLINYAYSMGYQLTFGDAWAKDGHKDGSLHYERLAIDLNLFTADGKYLDKTEDHSGLGEFWERMDKNARWGGHFGESKPGKGDGRDGNHYEYSL